PAAVEHRLSSLWLHVLLKSSQSGIVLLSPFTLLPPFLFQVCFSCWHKPIHLGLQFEWNSAKKRWQEAHTLQLCMKKCKQPSSPGQSRDL
uniref:Uncharacterized protein n=1 Tax=Seriola lalandi dorsalis TaxID=1841481 RepID=A0A3B4WKV9_SERLL